MLASLGTTVAEVAKRYLLRTAAVQDDLANRSRQPGKRYFGIEAVMPSQRLDQLEIVSVAAIPASDRTAGQAQFRVADNTLWIEELLAPETITGRTGAAGIVERKHPRLQFRQAVVANRAGEA